MFLYGECGRAVYIWSTRSKFWGWSSEFSCSQYVLIYGCFICILVTRWETGDWFNELTEETRENLIRDCITFGKQLCSQLGELEKESLLLGERVEEFLELANYSHFQSKKTDKLGDEYDSLQNRVAEKLNVLRNKTEEFPDQQELIEVNISVNRRFNVGKSTVVL